MRTYAVALSHKCGTICTHIRARSHEEAFNQALEILDLSYDEVDSPVVLRPVEEEGEN